MYAVIATGGKQIRVTAGKTFDVEKLDAEVGSTVRMDRVLMVGSETQEISTEIGSPYLTHVKVEARVVSSFRARKIRILKFKRRKHHMKRAGHRQNLSKIQIVSIEKE